MRGTNDLRRFGAVLTVAMVSALASAQTTAISVPNEPAVPTENPSSSPNHLYAASDALYFSADDGIHGRELWMWQPCNGRRGHVSLVADVVHGQGDSDPVRMTETEGWLYFVAHNPNYPKGEMVWAWNSDHGIGWVSGKEEDERPLSDAHFFGLVDGRFLLSAYQHAPTLHLFVLGREERKATELCVLPKTPGRGGESPHVAIAGDTLFFYSGTNTLGRSDGTPEGTCTFYEFDQSPTLFIRGAMGPLADRAACVGLDEVHGRELWISDGTEKGTHLVRDIAPGTASSDIGEFALHKGTRMLYFSADDGQHGRELWKTDGTPDGTELVKDINPGRANSNPYGFVEVGPWLYFLAEHSMYGKEVWRTDGSAEGTAMLTDLVAGCQGSDPWRLTEFGGRLFFCANSPTYGEEVFVSDGTRGGTRVLRDIVYGPASSGPHNLTVFRDLLFFTCDDGLHGEELWMTDGTTEGTCLAADIRPLRFNPPSHPTQLTAAGDRLFFTVNDREHGEELWVSDGTSEGTAMVRDIAPGHADSAPRGLCVLQHRVVFSADDGLHGREIWCSDGTSDGTSMVRDIAVGPAGTRFGRLEASVGTVRFEVLKPDGAMLLWETDGTQAGTRSLGPAPAHDRSHGEGVAPGASASRVDVVELGFFVRHTRSEGSELWRKDESDTDAYIVRDIYPGPASSSPSHLCTSGNMLYFAAEHPVHGRVLWRTDGTLAGTDCVRFGSESGASFFVPVIEMVATNEVLVMSSLPVIDRGSQPENAELRFIPLKRVPGHDADALCNLRLGPKGSWPRQLTRVGDRVFFTADDGVHGDELWVTDGTPEGTRLVQDILGPSDLSTMAH